jgi:uncharacterized protein involved in exopolysaccharide biosynthesis
MARSYLETFFRHKYLLMLPVVLGFVVGAFFAFQVPRSYVAGASIWADTNVPDPTTVGTTGGQTPPSAGQAALLTQLLATRSFMQSVVETSPLAQEFGQMDQLQADQLIGEVASTISVATPGPQLMTVSTKRKDPAEAIGLASAVVTQFEQAQGQELTNRAKAQVQYDKKRLEAAQQALRDAPRSDAIQSLYAEAAKAYSASTLNLAALQTSGVRVLDEPTGAYPQARRKVLLFGAAGGLLAGLTVALLGLILLMARDRAVRGEDDLESLGLELGGTLPRFAPDVRTPRRRVATRARG